MNDLILKNGNLNLGRASRVGRGSCPGQSLASYRHSAYSVLRIFPLIQHQTFTAFRSFLCVFYFVQH